MLFIFQVISIRICIKDVRKGWDKVDWLVEGHGLKITFQTHLI